MGSTYIMDQNNILLLTFTDQTSRALQRHLMECFIYGLGFSELKTLHDLFQGKAASIILNYFLYRLCRKDSQKNIKITY